jgi:hypothetical protein
MPKPEGQTDSASSMSLEEARSVMWLRNNYRPLGELLDEGFLDQGRLEWAAQNAYDPKLKQAASVLLDWVRRNQMTSAPRRAEQLLTLDAGMTIEQARLTMWPFRPLRGQPMGELVDTRQLTLKDLGYAVENAWEDHLRRAAAVLMAVRLSQAIEEPPPPAGPLKVVSGGRSYAEERQLALTSLQGFALGVIFAVWCGALVISSVRIISQAKSFAKLFTSLSGVIAFVILISVGGGIAWLLSLLIGLGEKKLDREMDAQRKGQEGEESIVEAIRQALDGNWTLFRNVVLPGRKGTDIDGILVGPPGVWALEIKNWGGAYRNIGEHWEYRAGNQWKLLKKGPSGQSRNNARKLSDFLKADGVTQWITPVVIWANRESSLSTENPIVAVWTLDRLPEELGNIWHGTAMEESVRDRILEKLTKLCERQAEEEG